MIGDQADMLQRLQRLMPNGWFQTGAVPIRDGMLTGIANVFAFIYKLMAYVRLQTRIATATDGFLDIIAFDFFGGKLTRGIQNDASFRASIISFLFRKRCTRQAIIDVIEDLLGTTPIVTEPLRSADVGCWDATMYYDVAGVMGDTGMPLQCFVDVSIPAVVGQPRVGGYGSSVGAYSTPSRLEYITPDAHTDQIAAQSIYTALDSVRPVTGVIWVKIIST